MSVTGEKRLKTPQEATNKFSMRWFDDAIDRASVSANVPRIQGERKRWLNCQAGA
jgi:hypothetical protein